MPKYDIKVIVEYYYEVEAANQAEAEKEGWNFDEHYGEVYSIKVEEQPEEPLYDNHTEVSQEEWEDMEYERLQRKAH